MNKTLTKFFAAVGVIALVGGIVIGCMQAFAPAKYKPSNWGNHAPVEDSGNKDNEGEKPNEDETELAYIDFDTQASGNLLSTAALDAPMSRAATSGDKLTVTATVRNSEGEAVNGYYQAVVFEGVGNDFDTYFNMSVEGNTVNVTCKKAFDGEREFKCTSVCYTNVYATYKMSYAKRPSVITVDFGNYGKGAGKVSTNGVFDGFDTTLKLNDNSKKIFSPEWINLKFNLFDSVEMGTGSVENPIQGYSITVNAAEELNNWLIGKVVGSGAINSITPTPITSKEVSQTSLISYAFGNELGRLYNYKPEQVSEFIDYLIGYSQGGTVPCFTVEIAFTCKYGKPTKFEYPLYCNFCDVSDITFDKNDGHIF